VQILISGVQEVALLTRNPLRVRVISGMTKGTCDNQRGCQKKAAMAKDREVDRREESATVVRR